jgi:hypothetical protein
MALRSRNRPDEPGFDVEGVKLSGHDSRPSLSTLLLQSGVLSEDEVQEANATGRRTGETLGEVIVRNGWATADDVAALEAQQWELPFRSSEELSADPEVAKRLPHDKARNLGVLPIEEHDGGVVVAVAWPSRELFSRVRQELGEEVSFVVTTSSAIEAELARLGGDDGGSEKKERPPAPAPKAAERAHDEEPAVAPPALAGLVSMIDDALARLQEAREELLSLEGSLASSGAKLEEERAEREKDAERIRELETELSQRDGRLETFRSELASLTRALESDA